MAVNVSMHQGSNPWNFAEQIGKSLDRAITVEFQKKKLSEDKRQHWVDTKFKVLKMERDDLQNDFSNTLAIINSIDDNQTTRSAIIAGITNDPGFMANSKRFDVNKEETKQWLIQQGYDQKQIDAYSASNRNPVADLINTHTNANMIAVNGFNESMSKYRTDGGALKFTREEFNINDAYGMKHGLQALQNNSVVNKSVKDKHNIPSEIKLLDSYIGNYHFIKTFPNLLKGLPQEYIDDFMKPIYDRMYMTNADGQSIPAVWDNSLQETALLSLKTAMNVHKDDLDYQEKMKGVYERTLTMYIPNMVRFYRDLGGDSANETIQDLLTSAGNMAVELKDEVIPRIQALHQKGKLPDVPIGAQGNQTQEIMDLQNQISAFQSKNVNNSVLQAKIDEQQAQLDELLKNQSFTTTSAVSDTGITTQPSSSVPSDTSSAEPSDSVTTTQTGKQFVTTPSGQNYANSLSIGDIVGDITGGRLSTPQPSALGLPRGEALPEDHRWLLMDIKKGGRDPNAQFMLVDRDNSPILHTKTGKPYTRWVPAFEKSLYDNSTIFGNIDNLGKYTSYKNSRYGSIPEPTPNQIVIPSIIPKKTIIKDISSADIDIL